MKRTFLSFGQHVCSASTECNGLCAVPILLSITNFHFPMFTCIQKRFGACSCFSCPPLTQGRMYLQVRLPPTLPWLYGFHPILWLCVQVLVVGSGACCVHWEHFGLFTPLVSKWNIPLITLVTTWMDKWTIPVCSSHVWLGLSVCVHACKWDNLMVVLLLSLRCNKTRIHNLF